MVEHPQIGQEFWVIIYGPGYRIDVKPGTVICFAQGDPGSQYIRFHDGELCIHVENMFSSREDAFTEAATRLDEEMTALQAAQEHLKKTKDTPEAL